MANATILYACTPDGLAITNKPGTLPEWLPPRLVLGGQPVISVWAEPGPPIRVLAVAGARLLLSDNGGRTWDEVQLGTEVRAIFPGGEPRTLYAAAGNGLSVSPDGGSTWNILPPLAEAGHVRALLPDHNAPDRLYLLFEGNEGTLTKGNPQEGDWEHLPVNDVIALAQDAGTGDVYAATPEGIQMSADGGTTFALLPGSPPDVRTLLAIPGAAGKPAALVVATSSGLQVSPDAGGTWQVVKLPQSGAVTALAHDPERRDRLYAATDTGYLFESGNRGQAWEPINSAPLPPVTALYVIRI